MAIQTQMYSGLPDNGALCFISQEQHLMQRVQQPPPTLSQTILVAHRIEIDTYINEQSERLRTALQEERRRQAEAVMKRYESKVRFLIGQKEREIEIASRRSAELQEFLKRMEAQRNAWQEAARENESLAASLARRLREASAAADDAESCCSRSNWDDDDDVRMRLACKRCRRRESSVIMLPCRHLCSCRDCDSFLDTCPVCNTLKKASIQAFF